jgi:HEAT repeat protein
VTRHTTAQCAMVDCMNKHLDDAITRLKSLPDDRQREAAEVLFDFLEGDSSDIDLTPEQIAEIKRRLADDEPFASDAEVRATFERLTR